MLDAELLQMIFEELLAEGTITMTYDEWVTSSGYTSDWTDYEIFMALPTAVQNYLGGIGITFSGGHGGIDSP